VKKRYRSFRKQYCDCRDRGISGNEGKIDENGVNVFACKRDGATCHSGTCGEERGFEARHRIGKEQA